MIFINPDRYAWNQNREGHLWKHTSKWNYIQY